MVVKYNSKSEIKFDTSMLMIYQAFHWCGAKVVICSYNLSGFNVDLD